MSTYFSVGDKVNIKQTDIEIRCEGSDEFGENQVIGIFIPPSVSLYSGKDTTLNFDVLIEQSGDTPAKCVLDSITGANGLFSKCTVYAGNRTQVIETLDHYSSWVSVKYSYDTNDSMRSRRAVVEGCGEWLPSSRGTFGTAKSIQSNHMYSPYVEQANKDKDPTSTITAKCPYTKASVSLPIHMGLFAQNQKAVPNLALQGTYIEFTCESNAKVMRILDSTALFRKTALNPVFFGVDSAQRGWTGTSGVAVDGLTRTNDGTGYTNVPAGTVVSTTSSGAGTGCTCTITIAGNTLTALAITTVGIGYAIGDTITLNPATVGAGNGDMVLTVSGLSGGDETTFFTQKWNSQLDPQHSPFQVGQKLECVNLTDNSVATFSPDLIISQIEDGGDPSHPIKYTCGPCRPDKDIIATTTTGLLAPEWVFYANTDSLTPTYKISNVRLIVRQLEVPDYERSMLSKMKSGGKIMYDVPSVACVLASATSGELQTSISIPCEHSKARSIISMPTDNQKIYTTSENANGGTTYLIDSLGFNPVNTTGVATENRSDRSGVSGIGDYLSSYNYIIDQKTVPSRKVNTNKSSSKDLGMNMDHIIELEKSLMQSHGSTPRSFQAFKSNFLLGRALTLDPNTIYDGRGKDIRLVARYEETTPPEFNKLWKNFISHIKTVHIEGANIQVQQ
jgi:hypothetical protein